jgi:hypothetical protein
MGMPPIQQPQPSAPAVRVYWQDVAGAGNAAIQKYFQAVEPLYAPFGIDAEPMPTGQPLVSPHYEVVFTNHALSPEQNDADGYAVVPARRGYVYLNQLAGFSGNKDAAAEEILAHELGHLWGLGHTVSGVMAPDITPSGVESNLRPLDKKQLKQVGITLRDLAKTK